MVETPSLDTHEVPISVVDPTDVSVSDLHLFIASRSVHSCLIRQPTFYVYCQSHLSTHTHTFALTLDLLWFLSLLLKLLRIKDGFRLWMLNWMLYIIMILEISLICLQEKKKLVVVGFIL